MILREHKLALIPQSYLGTDNLIFKSYIIDEYGDIISGTSVLITSGILPVKATVILILDDMVKAVDADNKTIIAHRKDVSKIVLQINELLNNTLIKHPSKIYEPCSIEHIKSFIKNNRRLWFEMEQPKEIVEGVTAATFEYVKVGDAYIIHLQNDI